MQRFKIARQRKADNILPRGPVQTAAPDAALTQRLGDILARHRLDSIVDARNPLDVVGQLVQITGDRELVQWLCAQADGFFVANPKITQGKRLTLLAAECELVKECGELLAESFQAVSGKELSPEKVSRLRADWEKVKAVAERFVRLVEQGVLWRNMGWQAWSAAVS